MSRSKYLFIFFLNISVFTAASAGCNERTEKAMAGFLKQDSLNEKLNLFYGRMWRDLYYMVDGDQFLFSADFLPGSVTLNGKTFNNVNLRYDIFKDEILTPFRPGGILQLNKEMVDSFSFSILNKVYRFTRLPEDTINNLKGYAHVIYKGKTSLYIKYSKKIDRSKTGGENEKFYQITKIYFMKDNSTYLISNKKDLLKPMSEFKDPISNFIKKNRLSFSKQDPESFIPVIRYFDTIRK
jgi:hypothetical protein